MKTEQQLKAEARKSAQDAPKPDPKIAKQAIAEAKSTSRGKTRLQRLSTGPILGDEKNKFRDPKEPLSDFDDPAANTVRATKPQPHR